MKLLVTGGAGFIGSNFIHYWLKEHPQDQIVNLDKLTYAGHLESLKDIKGNPNYQFIRGDIADREVVKQAMEGVNAVVHFAAESHVDRSNVDPITFVTTNDVGTIVLLEAAFQAGVKRFHHVSTDEVYGELKRDDPPFKPDDRYNPNTIYAASKAGSDHLVRAFFRSRGLPITISNCANNYGPFQDPEKVLPRFITNLIEGEKVPLMKPGEEIREWIHVEDHCFGIDIILQKGEPGETYLLQGEERVNLDVTRKLLEYFGKDDSWIDWNEPRLGHDFRYANDGSKIRSLGWERRHNFDEELPALVNWYKENEWWWKPLKMGRPNVDRAAQKGYNG